MDIKELNKLIKLEIGKSYLFSKHLTFRSKLILLIRNVREFILNIDVFSLTGLFVFFILVLYMDWYKALIIGIFGYMIYLRIEETFLRIKKK